MSNDVAIHLRNVTKRYYLGSPVGEGIKHLVLHLPSKIRAIRNRTPFEALHDVSFDVYKGECLSLVGRNGAGKSTTLSLIAGVLRPSEGVLTTRGRICPLLELGAGFNHELTGRENIMLNGVLLGLTRREVRERTDEIIEFSELGDFVNRPLRTYSSGMVVRLGFAIAVHLEPEILLIDEVLAVGDARFRQKCLDRMDQFRNNGTTMIFVSHDMSSVSRISDRVALFEAGRLVDIGKPSEVLPQYEGLSKAAA